MMTLMMQIFVRHMLSAVKTESEALAVVGSCGVVWCGWTV